MVAKFKSELGGSVTTIGTGGYIDLVESAVSSFDVIEENLNLKGLQILNKRMSGEGRG
jgi:pantothenate kinase type III